MGDRLENSLAVVIGGGAHSERVFGIGEAACQRLAEEGSEVVVADIHKEMAQKTADFIENESTARAHAIEVDLTEEDDIASLAAFCEDTFDSVDVLVNNAGIRVESGSITESTSDNWEAIFNVNLKGIADCCKYMIPLMAETDGGSIVNVSSANAQLGRKNWSLYDATKAGLLGLTRDIACDHAEDGIRANAVLPGPTLTDYHIDDTDVSDVRSFIENRTTSREDGPGILKRQADPLEIANGILFLASPASSFVTGTSLNVDGGLTAAGYDV